MIKRQLKCKVIQVFVPNISALDHRSSVKHSNQMATSKSYRPMPSSNISKFSNDNSGLLTTVADLPYNFKLQYVSVETPLDLSLKSVLGQITPPHSPQRSPLKKRPYHHIIDASNDDADDDIKTKTKSQDEVEAPAKLAKKEVTPNGKQIKVTSMPKTQKSVSVNKTTIGVASTTALGAAITTVAAAATAAEAGAASTKIPLPTTGAPSATVKEHKRVKAVRKLKFDEKKSSPVSGTIIRALDEIDGNIPLESGDIDPQYNIVEVTDEAKAEIAAIPNVIGAYLCKLCQIEFDDAFCLARHRCSCIVLLEYRCPECGKRFNCPANLASHRRWHKPKDEVMKKSNDTSGSGNGNGVAVGAGGGGGGGGVSGGDSSAGDENAVQYPCTLCGKFFKRQAYLRKHLVTHNKPNSKTNKRAIQLASDPNDGGKSGNSIGSGSESNATAINTRIGSTTTAISGRRSKSVCSDDSVSSSQDSLASTNTGVRFTFNVNSSSSTSSSSTAAKTAAATATAVEHVSNGHEARAYDMAQSSRSPTHFRLFKSEIFTEEENIAAAALAHLRHGTKDSVIRHTTALST